MSLMSRRAAALGILLAAVLWLLRELRRRRDRLAALQLRGPSTPPTLPRPPSGRLLADDDGPRVTLRVSITKMKVRNLPEAPPPPWLLRAFVNPRPRLTLELRWADQSLDTGAGVAVPLEHCTSWPDSFAFEHEAAAAALSTQLLQVTALRDGRRRAPRAPRRRPRHRADAERPPAVRDGRHRRADGRARRLPLPRR